MNADINLVDFVTKVNGREPSPYHRMMLEALEIGEAIFVTMNGYSRWKPQEREMSVGHMNEHQLRRAYQKAIRKRDAMNNRVDNLRDDLVKAEEQRDEATDRAAELGFALLKAIGEG